MVNQSWRVEGGQRQRQPAEEAERPHQRQQAGLGGHAGSLAVARQMRDAGRPLYHPRMRALVLLCLAFPAVAHTQVPPILRALARA